MSLAVDKHGNRLAPTKGAKGVCPGCGGEMRAKCGSIVAHHWAHVSNKDCDSWAENISPWHAAWQDCFPAECQEVWLGENNEHRADVKGDIRILEVQKSPLSPEKIREREEFYGEMAWMLCGEDFISNIEFHSTCRESSHLAKQSQECVLPNLTFSFSWKRMRRSWLAAKKPLFIHFPQGIGFVSEIKDGGGWINFISTEDFASWIDLRFDPSPVCKEGQGFHPLKKDFVKQCKESGIACKSAQEKAEKLFTFCRRNAPFLGFHCDEDVSLNHYAACVHAHCLALADANKFQASDYICNLRQACADFLDSNSDYWGNFFCPWHSSQFTPRKLFSTCDSTDEVKVKEKGFLDRVGMWEASLCKFEKLIDLHRATQAALGSAVSLLDLWHKNFLDRKKKVFRFRFDALLAKRLVSLVQEGSFYEFVEYVLWWKEAKDLGWVRQAGADEFKSLISLMPEDYRARVRKKCCELWGERQRERRLREREEDERKVRFELHQRNIVEKRLNERLSWPLSKSVDCFCRATSGQCIGEFSLADAAAMDPGASWVKEVDDNELMMARARIENFEAASIWRQERSSLRA